MEKRLILALILSLATIFLYTTYFMPKPKPRTDVVTPAQPVAPTQNNQNNKPANETPKAEPNVIAETKFPRVIAEKEEEFVLETEHHRAVFTNRGALLKELRLKDYYTHPRLSDEEKKKVENWVLLISQYHPDYSALRVTDPFNKLGGDPNVALWQATPSADGRGIEYRYSPGNGVTLVKKIQFPKDSYHADFSFELENQNKDFATSDWILDLAPTAGIVREDFDADRFYPHPVNATGYQKIGGEYELQVHRPDGNPPPALDTAFSFPQPPAGGSIAFVGDYNKYFAAFCKPLAGTLITYTKAENIFDEPAYQLRKKTYPAGSLDADLRNHLYRLSAVRCGLSFHIPQPGAAAEKKNFLLYFGPKDPHILRDTEKHPEYQPFTAVLDHDVWVVGRFLLWMLKGLWYVTRNYGVAIILLTLLVRAVLFPISRKQQISMSSFQKKIAKIQPQLDTLKKKHKDNKTKLYEEQMKLYKANGVTTPPLMGCLPILLQIPVFIGLFTALQTAFDLRHASFLWVNDLARPDQLILFGKEYHLLFFHISALNILPILMVIVWIWQQRTMPAPADPQQAQMQKIMAWFPLVFGFMLYNYAAGLSLYMTTSSISGILEQRSIKKQIAAQSEGTQTVAAKA